VGAASDGGASGGGAAAGAIGARPIDPNEASVSSSASSALAISSIVISGFHWVLPAIATCASFGTRPDAMPRTSRSVVTGPTCDPAPW
jgi:hypothetical protein